MEFELLGWPPSGPTLRLDFRTFSYAGKFVMTTTGKAVIRGDVEIEGGPMSGGDGEALPDGVDPSAFEDDVLAAVAFNDDRTDPETLWLRYVTVHAAHRGRGLGPRLLGFIARRADSEGYERCRIAVNNPFAYEAAYSAGFGYTGRRTGIAELVLERPDSRTTDRYREGLKQFLDREFSPTEREFLERKLGADPPETVDPPK